MSEMGHALMGTGFASGEGKAVQAAQQAISSPLLEGVSIRGAQGVLVNITGGSQMTLHEISEATTIIYEEAGDKANIIFGAVIDEDLQDSLFVTVIATGFDVDARIKNSIENGLETKKPVNHEVPTFMRDEDEKKSVNPPIKLPEQKEQNKKEIDMKLPLDDLDIPAFLRKQID